MFTPQGGVSFGSNHYRINPCRHRENQRPTRPGFPAYHKPSRTPVTAAISTSPRGEIFLRENGNYPGNLPSVGLERRFRSTDRLRLGLTRRAQSPTRFVEFASASRTHSGASPSFAPPTRQSRKNRAEPVALLCPTGASAWPHFLTCWATPAR